MFDWFSNVWQLLSDVYNLVCQSLYSLVQNIDAIDFTTENAIIIAMGLIRYVVGDVIYAMFYMVLIIGIGITVFALTKVIVNAILSVMPGIRGRIE